MGKKDKFIKGAIIGLLSDPRILFETISTVIEASLEVLPLDVLLSVLDSNMKADEVYARIPVEYIKRIRSAIGDVDAETLKKIRAYAVKYVNVKNVMLYLRENNMEIYTILINHPNGKKFMEDFINYTLQNLDKILLG